MTKDERIEVADMIDRSIRDLEDRVRDLEEEIWVNRQEKIESLEELARREALR